MKPIDFTKPLRFERNSEAIATYVGPDARQAGHHIIANRLNELHVCDSYGVQVKHAGADCVMRSKARIENAPEEVVRYVRIYGDYASRLLALSESGSASHCVHFEGASALTPNGYRILPPFVGVGTFDIKLTFVDGKLTKREIV